MKTLFLLVALVATCLCLAMPPVVTGPFLFSIPIVGISENSVPVLEDAFHELLGDRNFLHPEIKDGELHFYGGGGGFKALLTLEKVTAAVKLAGFKVDRTLWRLKPQMLGISLSSKEGVKTTEVIAALGAIEEVSVEDSLLIGDTTYHVIHLGRATNYSDFVAAIGESKLEVDDLLWGHWKYGWEIEEDEHGHSHDMGMTLIRKTASD
ncbi:MAG TPA: hypothetical protein EYN79_10150 [Planctomycetes bacterium]|nr:hypothetical protein [Planctomycetota bacterium]